MSKRIVTIALLCAAVMMQAQQYQLPDPHFENWSEMFKDEPQLHDWHGSNVSQIGLKFVFAKQKPGRTGKCGYVRNTLVGALGITAVGPGYLSLGTPWQYLKGLTISSATAGTTGGIAWTHRPDTIAVWIKRTGNDTDKEDFHVLYYSWLGSSKSNQYKNKAGKPTVTERVNEESDVRLMTDGNEYGVQQKAQQVAEGWLRARAKYEQWTLVKVPIFYCSDAKPAMCNVIFSSGNYPAFRANDGLYDGNDIYVDDVELIYSSKIDKLLINGEEWKGFDPNSDKVQTCKLSEFSIQKSEVRSQSSDIKIEGLRGIGQLTNMKGKTAQFKGRKLDNTEMSVTAGAINGAPWTITVKAEDGSSTHTYKVKILK